jgi:hypothetical protein
MMPITYTNRKGRTYYLCQGSTKTGKPRYYFAREPKEDPVEEIPEGYEISESVNAVVSLVRVRPVQIRPEELAAIKAAVQRHPRSRNYRVRVKGKRIEVYELVGPDVDDLMATLGRYITGLPEMRERFLAEQERHARFTPVLRFILADAETRDFDVQRWCYLGRIDDWIDLHLFGPLDQLAPEVIPTLGTDRFFELY